MAIIINGVVCEERVHQYSESVDLLQGPSARKGFLCNWADRFKVAVGLLGLSHTTSIGGSITLQTPMQHPEMSTTYAHSIEIEPYGRPLQGSPQLTFDGACVWCNYRTMPWSFSAFDNPYNQIDPAHPYTWAEQRLSSSVEWIQAPGSGCTWLSSGKPVGDYVAFPIWNVDMEITIKNMPYMPTVQALTYSGAINSTIYLGVSVRCLMYNGCSTQQQAMSDGSFIQETSYKFAARQYAWDQMFNPTKLIPGFDTVLVNSGPLLPLVDLSVIIPTAYEY